MPFPVVPIAPGVPPLNRDPTAPAPQLPDLMTEDETSGFGSGLRPQWGVFLNGVNVVSADTVIAFDFKAEEVVADFPLERGSFESYDKVDRPYEARVQFVAGGSEANRSALLESVAAVIKTLEFYDVVTPEIIYRRANVTRYDYRRTTANGVGLIVVDVVLQELRVQGNDGMTDTQAPSGADPRQGGNVDTTAPTGPQEGVVAT